MESQYCILSKASESSKKTRINSFIKMIIVRLINELDASEQNDHQWFIIQIHILNIFNIAVTICQSY